MADWTLGGKLDVAIAGLFGTSFQASYGAGVEVTSPTSEISVPTDYEFEIVSNTLIFQGDTVNVQVATTLDPNYSTSYLRVRGMNISTDDDRVNIYTDYDFDTNVCTYTQNQWYDTWNFGGENDTAVRMALRFGDTSSTIRTWTKNIAEMDFGVSEANYYDRFTVPHSSWPSSGGIVPEDMLYIGGNYAESDNNPVIISTINNDYSNKANSTTLIFPDFSKQTTYNDQVTYVTNYASENYPDLLPDILAAIPIFDDVVGFQYQPNNYWKFALGNGGGGQNGGLTADELYDVLTTETYQILDIDTTLPILDTWTETPMPTEYNSIAVDTLTTGYNTLNAIGVGAVVSSIAIFAIIWAVLKG